MEPVAIPAPPQRLYELLAEFPAELFEARRFESWNLVDGYGREWAVKVAGDLGLPALLAEPRSVDELLAARGFQPGFTFTLDGLLRLLHGLDLVSVEASEAEREGAPRRYRLKRELPVPDLAGVRERCLAVDPRNAPSLDILDLACGFYPAVATGKVRGQEAMFGLGQTRLWLAYFNNENPTYGLNNDLAGWAAVNRLPAGPLRILEVGGGGGSASETLLGALARSGRLGDVVRYRFTEPSPFFRRGAERKLKSLYPTLPLEVGALDLDHSLTGQGEPADGYDLVYGVNVLHVAHDLEASLRGIWQVVRPGGLLVSAEAVRSYRDQPLPTELVFLLLEGFWNVVLDPELRATPGFLTPDQWVTFVSRAGFAPVEVVPDHDQIRAVYPRFSTGVVCARRPA